MPRRRSTWPNKTDANDADGLAHLAEVGFYRVVRVKGFDSMLTRTLVAGRGQLRNAIVQMSNPICGLMKTFGLLVPKGAGRVFEDNVRRLFAAESALERIMLPLLEAWRSLRSRAAELDRQLLASSRGNKASALLMSTPGVGAVTASSYVAAVEDPANFKSSRSVGAWLALPPDAISRARWTMAAISRVGVTRTCGRCSMRRRPRF